MGYFTIAKVRLVIQCVLFSLLCLLISYHSNAQCCSTNLVEDSGYEETFTPTSNFPFGIGINNAREGNTSQWFYADGTNSLAPTIINDVARASSGNQFSYVPIGGTTPPFNRCIGNGIAHTTDLSACNVGEYTDGMRYVTHYDWVAFNPDVPSGGTGSTRPTFEFQSPFTIIDLYNEAGVEVTTNTTAVAWNDVANSWERVYGLTQEITDNDGIIVWYSHLSTATCGILMDDAYFAPLVINSADPGNIQETANASQITFQLNPSSNLGPVPNVQYTVSAPTGYSIFPTVGTYGTNTTFTLSINTGTMKDNGDLVIPVAVADQVNTACSVIASVTNPFDIDQDGITNDLDLDTDGDGIADTAEYLNVDPLGDEDGDGILNFEDTTDNNGSGDGSMTDYTDANNDGAPDVFDNDNDGIVNHFDLDADNDGIPDLVEAGGIDANGDGINDNETDTDNDGLVDQYDMVCQSSSAGNADSQTNTGVANPDNALGTPGTTSATVGNGDFIVLDLGQVVPSGTVINIHFARSGTNTNTTTQRISQSLTEGGTYSNFGVYTSTQNTSVGPEIHPYTLIGDARYVEVRRLTRAAALYGVDYSFTSNCGNTGTAMPYTDTDSDGLPDAIDLDADNDGITDVVENAGGQVSADNGGSGVLSGTVNNYTDTNDNNGWNDSSNSSTLDTDGDGVMDYLDIDADNDGIVDYLEGVCSTCPTFTTPSSSDANGNEVLDMYEVLTAANANGGANIGASPNMDDNSGNTTPDYLDTDTDDDGAFDWTEGYDSNNDGEAADDLVVMAAAYEAATSNNYYLTTDTDNDGIPDWMDNQPTTNGYNSSLRPPFLDEASSFWHDDDNDGLVDLFDADQGGSAAPTPDNNGGDDRDWRDNTIAAFLPVELVAFNVNTNNCEVNVEWVSASEISFSHYELQRSRAGLKFETITTVFGKGGENEVSYMYADKNRNRGQYYRLKMVDLDGTIEYSVIRFVALDCEQKESFLAYPNPVAKAGNGQLTIEYNPTIDEAIFVIFNSMGQMVRQSIFEIKADQSNVFDLDISSLEVGVYQLHDMHSGQTKMIVIQ